MAKACIMLPSTDQLFDINDSCFNGSLLTVVRMFERQVLNMDSVFKASGEVVAAGQTYVSAMDVIQT